MEPAARQARYEKVAWLGLEAGRIMLANGAETSRVEETIRRLGTSSGVVVDCVVTPTGITVSAGSITRLARIFRRGIDLSKVSAVNALSRSLEAGHLDLASASRRMRELALAPPSYSRAWHYLAQGLATTGFVLLLGGGAPDLIPALVAGLLVRALDDALSGVVPMFMAVFLSSLSLTLWATVAENLVPAVGASRLTLAGIFPLMPGLALTNSLRDLMGGDLLSGVARGADALLQAAALAAGVLVAVRAGQGWLV